jgi:hypothetical protein
LDQESSRTKNVPKILLFVSIIVFGHKWVGQIIGLCALSYMTQSLTLGSLWKLWPYGIFDMDELTFDGRHINEREGMFMLIYQVWHGHMYGILNIFITISIIECPLFIAKFEFLFENGTWHSVQNHKKAIKILIYQYFQRVRPNSMVIIYVCNCTEWINFIIAKFRRIRIHRLHRSLYNNEFNPNPSHILPKSILTF